MDGKSETSGYKCNCFGMSSSGVIKDHDKYIIKQKIACEIPVFNTDYLKQSMCQNKLTWYAISVSFFPEEIVVRGWSEVSSSRFGKEAWTKYELYLSVQKFLRRTS